MANTQTNLTSTQIAVKRLSGKAMTSIKFTIADETIGSTVQTAAGTVFAEKIPTSPDSSSAMLNIIQSASTADPGTVQLVMFEVDPFGVKYINDTDTDSGTPGGDEGDGSESQPSTYHGYSLKLTGSYEADNTAVSSDFNTNTSTDTNIGSFPFEDEAHPSGSVGKLQILPEYVGNKPTSSPNPYTPVLLSKTGVQIQPASDIDWYLDTYSGMLFIQDAVDVDASDSATQAQIPDKVRAFIYTGKYQDEMSYGDTVNLIVSGSDDGFDVANNNTINFVSGSAGITVLNDGTDTITIGADTDNPIFNDISASGDLYVSKSIFLDDGNGTYGDAILEVIDDSLEIKDRGNVRIAMDSDGYGGGTRRIQFGTGSYGANNFQPLMTITGSGNVGIGKLDPTEALELGTGRKLKFTSNAGDTGSIIFGGGDSHPLFSSFNTSAGGDHQFTIKHNLHSTELINRRGNIILSASSGNSVQINTSASATQGLTVQGNISASGFVSASSFSGNGEGLTNVVIKNLGDDAEQIVEGSLRVTQDVIAENYIVSSSVTYMTQSFSSGSTIFGDDGNDTHRFTGSLFVTGGNVELNSSSLRINTFQNGVEFYNGSNYTANRIKLTSAQNLQFIAQGSFQFTPGNAVGILTGKPLQLNTEGNVYNGLKIKATSGSVVDSSKLHFLDASDSLLMSLSSSGELGIGTDSYDGMEKLTVKQGYVLVTGSGASGFGFELNRGGADIDDYRLQLLDGGLTIVNKTDSNRKEMSFRGDGKIGIGITTPTKELTVSGSISASGDVFVQGPSSRVLIEDKDPGNYSIELIPANGPAINFGQGAGFLQTYMRFGAYSSINNLDTKARDFHLYGTNTTTGLYFSESVGRFGIGTTDPSTKLDVRGKIMVSGGLDQTRQIEIKTSGSGDSRSELILNTWRDNTDPPSFGTTRLYKSGSQTFLDTDEDFRIRPNNNGAFRVSGGGGNIHFMSQSGEGVGGENTYFFGDNSTQRIGIGTTSPNYLLDVESGSADLGIRLYNTTDDQNTSLRFVAKGTTGANRIWFGDTADAQIGGIIYRHNGNSLAFEVNSGERVRILSDGKVGIGTTTPSKELTVEGSISASESASIGSGDKLNIYADATNSTIDTKHNRLRLRTHRPQDWVTIQPDGVEVFLISSSGVELNRPLTASSDISASGLLFASASQPGSHTDGILAVVYDTGSGEFYYTGSYGAGGGTTSETIVITDNEDTDGARPIVFHDGSADGSSQVNLESDESNFKYNPGVNGGQVSIGSSNTLTIDSQSIDSGLAGTFDLLNDTVTTLNVGGAATAINMGAANGLVTIKGTASIDGDLYVKGNTTTVNTDNLYVEDQFILLNSGSANSVDSGIIIQTSSAQNVGSALYWDATNARWEIDWAGADAINNTATGDAAVVAVRTNNSATPSDPYMGAVAAGIGQMYVDTGDNDGDGNTIYIYA